MYFFAFPLLLLVASTVCASPVRIESRGQMTSLMSTHRNPPPTEETPKELSERFLENGVMTIAVWSEGPDEVVWRPAVQWLTMIKRVDLGEVVVPGVTDREHEIGAEAVRAAQRKQVDNEKRMLIRTSLLVEYQESVRKLRNGVEKTYIYFEIRKKGDTMTSVRSSMPLEVGKKARENGIKKLREKYGIILDPEHDRDECFSFFESEDLEDYNWHAFPVMLRYAKSDPAWRWGKR